MRKLLSISILVSAFIIMSATALFAGPPPPPPPPLAIPIDGGAVAILLAGAAYGAKKIYDRRKNEAQS